MFYSLNSYLFKGQADTLEKVKACRQLLNKFKNIILRKPSNTVCETGQRYRKDEKNVSLCLNVLKEEISIRYYFKK